MILEQLFNTLQKTLEFFFPSWDDIEKHREVVLFACGLMCDPTPLVDHVCQKWIDAYLEGITKGEYDGCDEYGEYRHEYDTDLLQELYAESNVQLPGSALHNNNINYYDHRIYSSDKTHVYTPSKMYMFLDMKENVLCKFYKREQEANIPECTLWSGRLMQQ